MKRDEALHRLRASQEQLNAFPIKRLAIFGSVARDEADETSDVDILVEFDPEAPVGLFEFARLQRTLGEILGCTVDLATPDALRQEMRAQILQEAVDVTQRNTIRRFLPQPAPPLDDRQDQNTNAETRRRRVAARPPQPSVPLRLCVTTHQSQGSTMHENQISKAILDAAIEVHRTLGGPGLLESVYEEDLAYELTQRGLAIERQQAIPVVYKGQTLSTPLRLDLRVNGKVIVECKATTQYNPIFEIQTLTYLRLTGCKLGLVINFGAKRIVDGYHRVVNGL